MWATWFQGSYEDFIRVSQEGYDRGVRIMHMLGGMSIDIKGKRAIAQTKMTISQRAKVEGVLCDVVCSGRFYDFLEKRKGRWGIVLRRLAYEKDRIDPVEPDARLTLDKAHAGAISGRLPPPRLPAEQDRLQDQGRACPASTDRRPRCALCQGRGLAQGQEALDTTRGLARAPGSAILNRWLPYRKPPGGAAMSLADKFNLLNEFNILRIICAVFFIPHIVGKITVPATLEFFVKAGFKPPATWMYIAGAIETVLCIGLVFRHLPPICRLHRLHPSAGRGRRHLQGHEELDLGDRRHRILRVLGDLLSRRRHARLSRRHLTFSALKGSPPNG